eukprot:3653405-Rhodomonas_salina.2
MGGFCDLTPPLHRRTGSQIRGAPRVLRNICSSIAKAKRPISTTRSQIHSISVGCPAPSTRFVPPGVFELSVSTSGCPMSRSDCHVTVIQRS